METYLTPEVKIIGLHAENVVFASGEIIGEDPDKGFGNLHD